MTSKSDLRGLRYAPMAFTEHGVAMLSTVLHSRRAISVNIQIIRTLVRLRQMLTTSAHLDQKLNALEQKYDGQFKIVFDAIRKLITPALRPKRDIGFRAGLCEK